MILSIVVVTVYGPSLNVLERKPFIAIYRPRTPRENPRYLEDFSDCLSDPLLNDSSMSFFTSLRWPAVIVT